MLCKIADLTVEVPTAYGMDVRCEGYLTGSEEKADIIIDERKYNLDFWTGVSLDEAVYLNSGWLFYASLLRFNGMMLHSSAVMLGGKAYLFSGPCGMGKSTHTRLYKEVFGERACIFNDDKPAIRKIDGVWYAYGTPWSGKHGINVNVKVPLAGICFLQRGKENKIRRLSEVEGLSGVISQTTNNFKAEKSLDAMLAVAEQLVSDVPIFEMHCTPTSDAAILSYETMSAASSGE